MPRSPDGWSSQTWPARGASAPLGEWEAGLKAQHTPGPWAVKSAQHPISDTLGVRGPQGQWVALVHPLTGPQRDPATDANARLIAAAPDLLKALERIAAGKPDHHGFAALVISEARAAIEAAIGRAA